MPKSDRIKNTDLSEADQKLVGLVLDYKDRFIFRRWIFEREWYRNILFYLGQQWIVYEEAYRRWRMRNMPSWVPLPVTNRLASTANVIRSSVAQINPAFNAMPTQENERSVLSANAADKYLEVIIQESGFRGAKRRLASWLTLTGNGFLRTEFDMSKETGMATIPGELCMDCYHQIAPNEIPEDMSCPECGSKNLTEDPSLSVQVPQGRLRVSALSPFEVYVDNNVLELEDQNAVLVIEAKSLESVRSTYGKAAAEVSTDNEREIGRYFMDSLSHMTGTGFSGGGGFRKGPDEKSGGVTLYHLYLKYHDDYPNGCFITMSGDQHLLEVMTPYPFKFNRTGKPFFPIVHVRYDDVPGRFWAKTPIDDLVAKQRQRNELESLFQTIIMRTANPIWLLPVGVQTTPITGDPGIQVRYTSSGGLKPERLAGVEAPASLIQFIQQVDQDFEEIANTFAVMKGKNPGSVRAASAIQMLLERGFGRYGSVFDNLEEAYETWAVQALEIWRQRAIFPRIQAVSQSAGSWQFNEFLGSDIGEVDIRVEAGSTRPRSQAGRQMLVGQALQWGLLNPNDPEQKMKIFEEMGMTSLLSGAEADVKVVAEENEKFMSWAQQIQQSLEADQEGSAALPPEQVMGAVMSTFPLEGNPVFDHHPTHLVHHRRFALSDKFRALPKVLQDMFAQHIVQAHYVYMAAEQATGMGPTGVMAGIMAPPAGHAGQSNPKGQPQQGGGPGGNLGKGSSKTGPDSGANIQNALNNPKPVDSGTVPR